MKNRAQTQNRPRQYLMACARPTACSDLARAQEMKMRQTEKTYVMDVPTISLLNSYYYLTVVSSVKGCVDSVQCEGVC